MSRRSRGENIDAAGSLARHAECRWLILKWGIVQTGGPPDAEDWLSLSEPSIKKRRTQRQHPSTLLRHSDQAVMESDVPLGEKSLFLFLGMHSYITSIFILSSSEFWHTLTMNLVSFVAVPSIRGV